MRLIAIIVLTSVMMLASLSHTVAAGTAMHDCPSCPESMMMPDHHAPDRQPADALCMKMATCSAALFFVDIQPRRSGEPVHPQIAWPEPRQGGGIDLSLDLPPPRI
ncbi:hypothetical protein Q4511_14255 [Paracoccus sp. 1_MG-2023]|uniref:hypothetical protein n=1 Tax=unclassified Paracoccus (in: a-proteobacteria) TaxID=2688777 RepID=UPI001C0986CE|nr:MULTISPECIES: hypothetical protein [unclassified Paracoccus (in: a-proteobacteria)]MBU2959174.1 hypothetical protein [Paracoccus sp. C2R09]MDO6670089.1 hypothetical protein [Paracoccus sp. 1_MG-2023]